MKIYDCTTFYSEHMMMDVRFNILDKHVEKFIVTESTFSHSGKKKKLNTSLLETCHLNMSIYEDNLNKEG